MALTVTPGVGADLKSRLDTGEHVISHDLQQIAGQTPNFGAGAVAAGTMRLTLASDDPAVAALGTVNTTLGTTNTNLGATNEGSAAADNSVSGLNGLIKRLLARLTALLPAALTAGGGIKAGIVDALPAGTALIGKVGIDQTTPGSTNRVDIGAALPAGTNLLGSVASPNVTGAVYLGTTALTPKFLPISAAASGDNTIVAGVASKKIRVLSVFLTNAAAASAVNVYFRENTAGTAICGDGTNKIALDRTGAAGAGGFSLPFSPVGHFESSSGNPLVLNLSAANGVAGSLCYVEV